MPATLDDLMQTASQALAEMDYPRCETLCVQALEQARADEDWVMAQRVLLPLQEARRQKRQAATDGLIMLGTPDQPNIPDSVGGEGGCGCLVLTRPFERADASGIAAEMKKYKRAVEVLYADNETTASTWRITSLTTPEVTAELPAPNADWIGQWVDPLAMDPPTPAHWFMQASEALGNAAIASIDAPPGTIESFDRLAEALSAVGDHELLHQRLADAAKSLHEAKR